MIDLDRAVTAVDRYLDEEPFSGSIRISATGNVMFERASGLADRANEVPNTVDTRFGIASITKMFTATAICRLVDRGLLAFEQRLVDLVPADKRPSTLSPEVTLHHLLTHTSGIADYFDEVNLGAAAFDQIWIDHPSYLFTETIDFLQLFSDLAPLRAPGGEVASYCSAGYILLGLVIEEATRVPYIDHVEQEIFRSAGMDDSGFFRLDDVRPRVATGYVETEPGSWKTNHYSIPVVGGPDGGAFSTTRDLSRFLDALSSNAFFDDKTWTVMSTPHVSMEDVSYGYGLLIVEAGRLSCVGHGGADPGFSGRALLYPQMDVIVATLGNSVYETDGVIGAFRSALEE